MNKIDPSKSQGSLGRIQVRFTEKGESFCGFSVPKEEHGIERETQRENDSLPLLRRKFPEYSNPIQVGLFER